MSDSPVDRYGTCAGLRLYPVGKGLDHPGNGTEVRTYPLRIGQKVRHNLIPTQIHGHIEYPSPVEVPGQGIVFHLQGINEFFQILKYRGTECILRFDDQVVTVCSHHLWRMAFQVVHPAAKHFRDQVPGSQVDGTHFRALLIVMLPKAISSPSLIQHLFHLLFILNPAGGMKIEIPVKCDAFMAAPPLGRQDNIHRQHFVTQQLIILVFFHCRFHE